MSDMSQTPAGLVIEKRNWKFGRDMLPRRWWHGGDPARTAFYNALSSTFPVGEKFFMSAVRHYRDGAPEPLREQIDDFIFQESTHSREHIFFNRQARDAGYDMTSSEDRAARTIAWAKRRPPIMQLAATCALEHFTAILANAVLADPAHLAGADVEAQRMWRWHAIEEIEHKAVAYDTWLHATREMPGWKRWALRSFAMLAAAVRFHYVVYRNTAELLAQDRKNNPRNWWRLLRYLYGDPGLMRMLAMKMFGYFRPGFHPWQHDDRALAARALATLTPPLVTPLPR
ncbi:metal-dependent hydrolase [Sphingopyxis sp.]|uniref:metal-dependent hydrolase n=1 Tax=Sphingopyxis sp. TaxID=1908224 RepID=UPI002E09F1C6|nr:metal-dependent hydrolase [Sphingopyxis sp.]